MTDPTADLRAASQAELDHSGLAEQLGAYSPADWTTYEGSMRVVMDYVSLADGGEPPPADEWHRALHELGEDRRQLANNADVAIRGHIAEWKAHLQANKHDLDQVIAALQDVEQTERDNKDATRLVHLVLKLKDIAEFAEDPSLKGAADLVGLTPSSGPSVGDLIEQGIANLAEYEYDIVLVSHGFASKEELHNRVQSAAQQVSEAAQQLHTVLYVHDVAERTYAIPAP